MFTIERVAEIVVEEALSSRTTDHLQIEADTDAAVVAICLLGDPFGDFKNEGWPRSQPFRTRVVLNESVDKRCVVGSCTLACAH